MTANYFNRHSTSKNRKLCHNGEVFQNFVTIILWPRDSWPVTDFMSVSLIVQVPN